MKLAPSSREQGTNGISQQQVLEYVPNVRGNPNDQFPTKEDLERLAKGKKYNQIYRGEFYDSGTDKGAFNLKEYFDGDIKKQQLLALSFNVVSTLFDKTTRFFIGGGMKYEVETKSETDKVKVEGELKMIVKEQEFTDQLAEASLSKQTQGYATFAVYSRPGIEGKPEISIRQLPYYNAFPVFGIYSRKPEEFNVADYYVAREKGSNLEKRYCYRQRYFLQNGSLAIEHTFWLADKWICKEKADIGLLGEDFTKYRTNPIEIFPNLKEIPIYTAHELKMGDEAFGRSRIEKIMRLVEEVNDTLTRISVQFIKNLNAKIAVPRSAVQLIKYDEEAGKEFIDPKELELFLLEQGDLIPQYITNENPLIEQAFAHIEKLLGYICASAECPASFLGLDISGGAEKVETVKLRVAEFLRKTEDDQRVLGDLAEKVLKMALIMKGVTLPEDLSIRVRFRDGLPRDMLADMTVITGALAAGIMSKETAVRQFQQIQDEELSEELKRISDDKEVEMAEFSAFNPKPVAGNNE